MIKKLSYPPECMNHMAWLEQNYYELSDKNGVYGYVALRFNIPECSLHFRVSRWSHSVFKSMLEVWPRVLFEIRKNGAGVISIVYPGIGDARMYKLLHYFGFTEPAAAWVSWRRV